VAQKLPSKLWSWQNWHHQLFFGFQNMLDIMKLDYRSQGQLSPGGFAIHNWRLPLQHFVNTLGSFVPAAHQKFLEKAKTHSLGLYPQSTRYCSLRSSPLNLAPAESMQLSWAPVAAKAAQDPQLIWFHHVSNFFFNSWCKITFWVCLLLHFSA
jgi:hypothetical protein